MHGPEKVFQKILSSKPESINVAPIIDSINRINNARTGKDMLDAMARGFTELGACMVCYAIPDESRMMISGIYPEEMLRDLNGIFGISIDTIAFLPERFPDNPLLLANREGRPILYDGPERMREFFSICFPGSSDDILERAVCRFDGHAMLVLPLLSEGGHTIGSVAIASQIMLIEARYDSFFLLACVTADFLMRSQENGEFQRALDKYRRLVESSRDMIFLCGFDGTIRYSNHSPAGRGIDAAGSTIFDYFTGINGALLRKAFGEVIQGGEASTPLEISLPGPQGSVLWCELTVKRFHDIESSLEVIARDITERKTIENRMASMQAIQNEIFHNEYLGIVTMDISGNITSWNNGAEKILGFTVKDVIGIKIFDILAEEDAERFRASLRGATGSSRQISRSVHLYGREGNLIPVMYILSDLNGKTLTDSFMVVFFDISERIRLEERSKELMSQLNEAQLMTILTLTKLTEYRDIETGMHLERIMKYTELIGRELSSFRRFRGYISDNYIEDLITSSPLHDIGKVGIPDSILHKPGKFTPEEFDIMKRHTTIGGNSITEAEKRVKGRSFLNLGKEVAFYHHERWDGSGYPRGLKRDEIPLSARIVALADVYDALTTKRPYKEAFSHDDAVRMIMDCAGSHFDASVVEAFDNKKDKFNYWREFYLDT